jgi:4-hydroxy-tetrahydrodipicolinate reductase
MKIAIAGASGRMGRMLIETVLNDSDATLSGALDRPGSPQLGQDAGAFLGKQTGVALTDDIERVFAESDYLIDFTRPEGTLLHLEAAQRHNVKMVIGTTGFDNAQKAQLRAAADNVAIMFASNMSVGVNVTLKLLQFAAKHFATGYDIEIIEAHHRHKVDAPSGTALTMGEVIANALGRNLDDCAVYSREGVTGERDPSAFRRFAAATSSAIIRCCLRASASALKSRTSRRAVSRTRRARFAPCVSSRAIRPASSTCRTCSACARRGQALSFGEARWQAAAASSITFKRATRSRMASPMCCWQCRWRAGAF